MMDIYCPQEDIDSVIQTYWHLREVREDLVRSLLILEGRKEEAIRVLIEFREMNKANKHSEPHDTVRSSLANETLKLADLYEEMGRTEDCKSELLYFLFQMKLPRHSKQALLDDAESSRPYAPLKSGWSTGNRCLKETGCLTFGMTS
ncbi:MAG: hypothetical protein LUD50_02615 [Clostridia bacterium]|nr:hypothetical protein [Clostridia bacterium]